MILKLNENYSTVTQNKYSEYYIFAYNIYLHAKELEKNKYCVKVVINIYCLNPKFCNLFQDLLQDTERSASIVATSKDNVSKNRGNIIPCELPINYIHLFTFHFIFETNVSSFNCEALSSFFFLDDFNRVRLSSPGASDYINASVLLVC